MESVTPKRAKSTPRRMLPKVRDSFKTRRIKLSEKIRMLHAEIDQLNGILAECNKSDIPEASNSLDFNTSFDNFDLNEYRLKFPSTITISVIVDGTSRHVYRTFRDMQLSDIIDDVKKMYQSSQVAVYAEIEHKTRILIPLNTRCSRLTELFTKSRGNSDVAIFLCTV